MKKSFLIVGVLGAIIATNGYAVQSQTVVVTYTCPAGCELIQGGISQTGSGISTTGSASATPICKCPDGDQDPTITIENTSPSPSEIQQVISQSVLNQAAIKNAKKTKATSVRAATVSPKVVKKIVYEEIVSDDVEILIK